MNKSISLLFKNTCDRKLEFFKDAGGYDVMYYYV